MLFFEKTEDISYCFFSLGNLDSSDIEVFYYLKYANKLSGTDYS